MRFTIRLPFGTCSFVHAQPKHRTYFRSQFFNARYTTQNKIHIEVLFKPLKRTDMSQSLEDTFFADKKLMYIADTKGKLAAFDFAHIDRRPVTVLVDPDYDLYYLYSFIIEPLYITIAAHHKILFLHASAVADESNHAYVFTAWRHTGKTDSILHLAKHGYSFLGDDYCVIHQKTVYVYPKKINLFSYNLHRFPSLFSALSLKTKIRLWCTLHIKELLTACANLSSGSMGKIFYRVAQLAEISTNIKVNPADLGITTTTQAPLRNIISLEKVATEHSLLITKISPRALQRKVVSIMDYELSEFFQYYEAYQYFFPNKRSLVIEKYNKNISALITRYSRASVTYNLGEGTTIEAHALELL